MADGSITFSTALDNTHLEKDLESLKKKIEKNEREIAGLRSKRDTAREEGALDGAVLDAEKAKLQEIKTRLTDIKAMSRDKILAPETREDARTQLPAVQEELRDQQTRVNALQTEWNKTENAVDRYTQQLADAEAALERQKQEAGALQQQIVEIGRSGAERMGDAASRANSYMERFTSRIKKLASRVFVFTLITSALRALRSWLGKAIRTNDEARQSIAQLKGALLTLAQPLVNIVIPAFIMLVNVLTRVVTAIAGIVSGLFGSTIQSSQEAAKNLYGEMNALEGVGTAAEDAEKSMASFDEINQISDNKGASGGGSGGTGAEIAPDFSFMDGMDDILDKIQQKIQDLIIPIGLVAAGFALWKISDMLPGALGNIATKLAGIAIAVGGVIIFWDGLKDAWENGVDWGNMAEMIGGVTLAALGLGIAFGPVAAGIALVVGGLTMLVTGFRDVMENGWTLENTLLTISGIFATGLGIALITGSFIPALIGAIAALLVAITVATGHGEELIGGIRLILEGFKDFFTGIFTGDIEKAIGGIGKIFDGLRMTFKAVIFGVRDMFLSFLTWLDEKTGGKFHGIIETAKGFVTTFYDNLAETVSNWLSGVEQAFSGLVTFVSSVIAGDWDKAWEGIKETFKGMWNSNIAIVQGAVNLIIKGLNWLISQMNKIKFDVPDWVPAVGGKSIGINIPKISDIEIPRLAQGAVIPPNREFLAVLGDQRSGTNLEAPEGLIRQLFREEMGRSEIATLLLAILSAIKEGQVIEVDRRPFGRVVHQAYNEESRRVGVNFAR